MSEDIVNGRTPETEIDKLFLERWSPRAFADRPIEKEKIKSLFEAAKWAPSCFNEQPWRFLYATEGELLKEFQSILMEKNQVWANKAPLLGFIVTKINFTETGKTNRWAELDAGAAWMSLTVQARKLGLYTHGMGGFNAEKAYEVLNIPKDEYKVLAAFVVGYIGDKSSLPEELAEREVPSDRKKQAQICTEGKFDNLKT